MKTRISRHVAAFFIFLFPVCSTQAQMASDDLPMWRRCFDSAVIKGHISNWPEGKKVELSFAGNQKNIKDEMFPSFESDSLGNFLISWDICYPLQFHLWGPIHLPLILTPGDTITLNADYADLTAWNIRHNGKPFLSSKDLLENFEFVRVGGPTAPLQTLPALQMMWHIGSSDIAATYRHRNDTYCQWREHQWNEHLERLSRLDTLQYPLSKLQQTYLRLVSEVAYVKKCFQFLYLKSDYWVDLFDMARNDEGFAAYLRQINIHCDSLCLDDTVRLLTFAEDMAVNQVDPHRDELIFWKDLRAAYTDVDDYVRLWLEANEQEGSSLDQWMEEVKMGRDLMGLAIAQVPFDESRLDSLPDEMREAVESVLIKNRKNSTKETTDSTKSRQLPLPAGKEDEWLEKIVKLHVGRVVFIDFWATWCGPCVKGMKAMATVRDSLQQAGVDFIYITDTGSSKQLLEETMTEHCGDYYIVPRGAMEKMKIPGFENAIPHYLIYHPDGTLHSFQSGWSNLEEMTGKISEALRR